MKKNLLLLFCYFCIFCFSQEYHFDYKCYNNETNLKGSYKGNKRTNIIYFNSENEDVMAYDYFFSQQPTRSFLLDDYKLNTMFSYSISHDSKFSTLNFRQIFPIKIYPDELKIVRVDVEKLEGNLFWIRTFSSRNVKKPNLELKVLIEKSDYTMPKIQFLDLTPNIHSKIYGALLSKLDSPKYRIVNVVTSYKNRVIMHDDFSKCEKINLKLLMKTTDNQDAKY